MHGCMVSGMKIPESAAVLRRNLTIFPALYPQSTSNSVQATSPLFFLTHEWHADALNRLTIKRTHIFPLACHLTFSWKRFFLEILDMDDKCHKCRIRSKKVKHKRGEGDHTSQSLTFDPGGWDSSLKPVEICICRLPNVFNLDVM